MKSVLKFVAAISVVVLLAGCQVVEQAGAAALVGDLKLTNDEVSQEFSAVQAAMAGQQTEATSADFNRQIVNSFIFANLVDMVAADLNVTVSDVEVVAQHGTLAEQAGGEEALQAAAASSGIAPEKIDRTLKMSLQFEKITDKFVDITAEDQEAARTIAQTTAYGKLVEKALSIRITVSSRYGSWDGNNLSMSDQKMSDVVLTQADLANLAASSQ